MKCKLVIRAVTIAGLLITMAASTVAGTPVRLSFRDTTIASGSALNYPIYVDSSLSGYSVRAFQIEFTYDVSKFTFIGATSLGTLDFTWGSPTYNEVSPGRVRVTSAGVDTLAGTGKLVVLQFTSKLFVGPYNQNGYFYFQAGANTILNQGYPTTDYRTGIVTLTPGPSITVSPNTATLTKGDNVQFTVSGGHSPYKWSTTAPSVGMIDTASGFFTAVNAGFTKVAVQDSNGYVDTSGLVEVRAFKLNIRDTSCFQGQTISVPVNCTNLNGIGVVAGQLGLTFDQNRWSVVGLDTTSSLVSNANPIFNVNGGSLSISFAGTSPLMGSGKLLAVRFKASTVSSGYTTFYVQSALFNQTLVGNVGSAVLINQALQPVNVTPAYYQTLVRGDSLQFQASGGVPPYTWSVSGSGRATISSSGLLKAIRSGMDTVRATDALGSVGVGAAVSMYDFRLSVPDTSMVPNTFVDVPVYVTPNDTGFTSVQFTVSYYTGYYAYLDSIVTTGTLLQGIAPTVSFHAGTANLAAAWTGKIFNGGTLLKLRFIVPDSTPRPSTTSVSLSNVQFNEGYPLALVKNGSFQIANRAIFNVSPGTASLHTVVGQKDSAVLTVRNTGTANLTSSVNVVGPSVFTVSISNINVLPGDSVKITVYFQPVSPGPASGKIRFYTNDSYNSQVDVPVTGVTPYPILVFSSGNVNFGILSAGQHKDTTITISNTGTDTLRITSIIGSLPVFTAHPTSANIAPGQSIVDSLRFFPSAGGYVSGRFSVTSNSLTTPDTVGVWGSGGAIAPILASSNTTFNFGIVSITSFKDTVVTVSNNGTDTLKISGISSSNSVFAARPGTQTIPPGQSFKDTLRFAPALAGGYSGRIFVTSNAPSSPDTITVSGTGHVPFPILTLSRSTVNFGVVKVGAIKDTVITISNSGTDTLKISSVTSSNIVFAGRPTSLTIPPGQFFSDTLRFAPAVAGGYSGRIVFTSNALSNPDTMAVLGTGSPSTNIFEPSLVPEAYSLQQNYPNPFNPSTVIRYGLRSRSTVRLVIFNILGQQVDELVNGEQNEGFHAVTWNPSVPSGAYFYKIDAISINDPSDHFMQIRKMILMK